VRFPPAARYNATASFLNSARYGDFRPTRTPFLGSAKSIARVSTPPGSPHALTASHLLDGCGHWIQQERPDEVNHLLTEWLATLRS
jgi:hypothetical protein